MQAANALPEQDLAPRFREMMADDAMEMSELAARFFLESEFKDFATFDYDAMLRTFQHSLDSPYTHFFVFEDQGKIQGFIGYQLDASYTVEPIGLMYLFYVVPEYRPTPAGRELLNIAENHAKAVGCVAFYGGSMSGIPAVQKTLPNLFRKRGYQDLYWGKKMLKE